MEFQELIGLKLGNGRRFKIMGDKWFLENTNCLFPDCTASCWTKIVLETSPLCIMLSICLERNQWCFGGKGGNFCFVKNRSILCLKLCKIDSSYDLDAILELLESLQIQKIPSCLCLCLFSTSLVLNALINKITFYLLEKKGL